jgi:DNA-binding HxlR family transcriptional regulator
LLRQRHLDQRLDIVELEVLVNRTVFHQRKLEMKHMQTEMARQDARFEEFLDEFAQFCVHTIK